MPETLDGVIVRSSKKRTMAKAISYRVVSIVLDFSVVLLFTRRLSLTVGITIVSNLVSALAYYLHERFWNQFRWGRVARRIDR